MKQSTNNSNPWFRMYHEFATDPKIQMLSEVDQRRFVMLLCFRCCNGDVTLHETEMAFQLRITEDEWAQTKDRLMAKELIDENSQPVAWNKRQYASDSSTVRVRKYRDKVKRLCNVSSTVTKTKCNALDTETDTDTETEKDKNIQSADKSADDASPPNNHPDHFETLWQLFGSFGSKGSRKKAESQFMKIAPDDELYQSMITALETQINDKTYKAKNGEFYENFPHVERWLRDKRWTDEISEPGLGKLTLDEKIDQAGRDYLSGRKGGIHGETVEGNYEVEIGSPDAGKRGIQDLGGGLQ